MDGYTITESIWFFRKSSTYEKQNRFIVLFKGLSHLMILGHSIEIAQHRAYKQKIVHYKNKG